MSEEVVGLARKDGRLLALVSVAHREPSEPVLRCELREPPVDAVRVALRPHQRRAALAWEGLSAADWDDPRVLAAALTVLIESVPLGDAGAGPRPPAQSALCAPDAWRRVRTAVEANERGVLRLLRRAGHGPAVATLVHARDPYVAYHHRAPAEPGLAALPPRFAAFVLPLLRSRPWPVVRRALAAYWALDLHRDDAALALAVHLMAKGPVHGLAWLEWMARDEPTRRDLMGRLLLETGALAHDPRALPARTLDVLAHEGGAEYCDRLAMMLHGLGQQADLEYLLEGVQVAQVFAPRYRFDGPHGAYVAHRHPGVPTSVTADLWRVLERIHESVEPNWWWSDAVWLWDWCASSPERAALIRRASRLDWPALTTFQLLSRLDCRAAGWSDTERFALAERLVPRTPASHQAKAVDALLAVLHRGRLEPERLAAAGELIVRMARPPFRPACDRGQAVALLLAAAGARVDRLARIPERSLLKLERALYEDGDDRLPRGLESLARASGGFLLDALAAHPEPLISAARHLAVLSAPRRLAVLKRFRSHPVCQRRFARQPLDRVCRTVEALVRRGLPTPIPRKLREHREGAKALSAGSLERHRQAIVRRLVPLRIALLVRTALEEMDHGLGTDLSSEAERHALEMLASVGANRRLLRRVLRVAAADREGFLERHPANRGWLARHHRIDEEAWRTGVIETFDLPDGRRLRLAFERDPMEVLRMGTRVGSCLSVGGCWSDSAVSVMADVNKRLVVARDAGGAFVARQLAAIADDDRLVLFEVYPLRVGEAVKDAFARYDRALAAALGLEVHRGTDEYVVAKVLARAFYDDGAWDPSPPEIA